MRLPLLLAFAACGHWVHGLAGCRHRAVVHPSFHCGRAAPGRIEGQVCASPALTALDRQPAHTVVAMFFATDPSSAVTEHGECVSMTFPQPTASGARSMGRNESLWEHHGEARVVWGYGAQEMTCTVKR